MAQPTMDEERSITQKNQPAVAKKSRMKKSYSPPSLLEYGSIAKLTQQGTAAGTDLPSGMMACL